MAYSITKYQLFWDVATHKGKIVMFSSNPFKGTLAPHTLDNLAYEDYAALVDMLRNEKPIVLAGNVLSTSSEPVGEEES